LEATVRQPFALSFCPQRFRRIQLSFFLFALTCPLLPIVAQAQVTFNGSTSVNLGSQAVGSRSATVSLSFTVGAGTKVGSIAVLTTGMAGKDFAQATGSTCTTMTYVTTTNCMVNVSFKPLVTGSRQGAVAFYAGTAKTSTALATVPICGVGTGPQVVFGPGGRQTSVGGHFISPQGVAVDAAGNVYVTDIGLQEVFKITPSGVQNPIGTGLEVPEDAAVDGAGNLYVTDSHADVVFKVTPGGVQTMIGSGFSYPVGVAVDGAGNVYVSDPFVPTVFQITPGGAQTMVGSGYNTPAGVAVDAAGNVYVADTFSATVFKITPNGTQTMIGSGLVSPAAVAVDAAENVYITDSATDTVYEVTPSGNQTTVSTGLDVPNGVTLDGFGNLYVADTFSGHVTRIDRADAPSLKFDPTKINSTSMDSPKTVEVENIGNASLTFSALSYPPDFPEASGNNECTSSTSLAAASTCALIIDFSPVTTFSPGSSRLLRESVKLTTNDLNVPKKVQRVVVTGKELRK
jgi:sugar lactone lactonase YvrE